MILLCEHPVFTGCESAQSALRSSLRRPGAPAGCSRCERSLDRPHSCVTSSRVVPLTCAPPPPWPHLSVSDGSDANTVSDTRDRSAPRSAPLPPANERSIRLPCLLIAPSFCLPPELSSRGINPR